jgi:hypothetical protein
MKWSGFLNTLTVIAGIASVGAMITGIAFGDKMLGTVSGLQLKEYATYLIYIAIWLSLGILVHLSKEDNE